MALDVLSIFDKGLNLVFGNRNERELEKFQSIIKEINSFEPKMEALSDEELSNQTVKLREKIASGVELDNLLPEAFATVREAGKRVLGMRHYDVQLLGGMVLHSGKISEMKTGEGKTLVATLPIYLNALAGKAHLVTVNEYLAERDAKKEGRIYEFLGLTVGVIKNSISTEERIAAYACDVTYGTNSEFGFDYLRDNMKTRKESQVQGDLNFVVVDEVDSVLIDEARTPLIISGPAEQNSEVYTFINEKVKHLSEGLDYNISEKDHTAALTEEGMEKAEKLIGRGDLYSGKNMHLPHYIDNALRAHHLFTIDKDYVIGEDPDSGELSIMIVDEFTGRIMSGRRWSDGLHQAIEAKEGIPIKEENQTLATITYQNFFRLYKKLSGMTGTASTEATEFAQIYKLDAIEIPTNKPLIRMDMEDLVYGTSKEKYEGIAEEIKFNYDLGRPTLIGTVAIENSELLSRVLKKKGVPHDVLNAKQHAREADIVTNAGSLGAITIATNMAGRGTDIVLRPFTTDELLSHWKKTGMAPSDFEFNKPNEELEESLREFWAQKFLNIDDGSTAKAQKELKDFLEIHGIREIKICENAKGLGGLFIAGTERHESRRIDNQLRGRSGRQGDPGASQFYLSLEDDLMRIFAPDMVRAILQKSGLTDGEALVSPLVSRSIKKAQKKVEERNYGIRKNLLEYDGVMNDQRKIIYAERQSILNDADLQEIYQEKIEETVGLMCNIHLNDDLQESERDYDDFISQVNTKLNLDVSKNDFIEKSEAESRSILKFAVKKIYDEKEEKVGAENMRELERFLFLQVIDQKWKEHLHNMDHLKEGIHLRGQAGKDPKVEYKKEGFQLFSSMSASVVDEVVNLILHVEITPQEEEELLNDTPLKNTQEFHPDLSQTTESGGFIPDKEIEDFVEPIINTEPKVGRNDNCPCGSGKKYKKCCGKGLV